MGKREEETTVGMRKTLELYRGDANSSNWKISIGPLDFLENYSQGSFQPSTACISIVCVCVFNGLTFGISLKRDGAEIPSQEMLRGNIVGVKAIDPWNDYRELASVVHPKEVNTRPEVS